jgi:hypothetical protein
MAGISRETEGLPQGRARFDWAEKVVIYPWPPRRAALKDWCGNSLIERRPGAIYAIWIGA